MLAGYVGNYSRYEIEKKFLLKKLPESIPEHYVDIHDLYLQNSSLRLRVERLPNGNIVGRKLTRKEKAPEIGEEFSVITSLYLTENDLGALGQLNGFSLKKRRYIQEFSERRIVFDQFLGELEGLVIAEIEFRNSESLSNFVLADADWEEVTGNPEFSGGHLAFKSAQKNQPY
jgi:CYTH domain-containing protein